MARLHAEEKTTANRTVLTRISRGSLCCSRCAPHKGCNDRRGPRTDRYKNHRAYEARS
jgi:hypothetical protein